MAEDHGLYQLGAEQDGLKVMGTSSAELQDKADMDRMGRTQELEARTLQRYCLIDILI